MLKNFRFIRSLRPIVHDTYKTAKINFINSGAADIRTVYYIQHLLVINSKWHLISYRFGVNAAYRSNFGHFAFL